MRAVLIVASDEELAARLILALFGAGLGPRLARTSQQAVEVARSEGPVEAVLVESTLPSSRELIRALAEEAVVATDVPMLVVAPPKAAPDKDVLRPEQVMQVLPGLLDDVKAARDQAALG